MARGKTKEKPAWMKISDKDVEAIVVKLAEKGFTPEKIGLELRDRHGIPTTKVLGKKISRILKENNLYIDSTEKNLEKKQDKISQHLEKNKQDKRAMRSFTIIRARISKYKKYKKRKDAEQTERDSKRLSKRKRK
jgi:small subunit ribosomal protein S15